MPVPLFVVVSVLVATVGSVVSSAITLNGAGNAPLQYVGDGAPVPPDLSYKNILVHTYTVAQVQRALQPYGAINNEPEF